jgi:hypothetical protein
MVSLALLGPAAGCGADGDVAVVETDDYRIFVNRGAQLGGPDMTVGGEVGYSPDSGCLYLVMDQVRWAIVWPDGTRGVRPDGRRAVEVPGFGVAAEGDVIGVRAMWADRHDQTDAYAPAVNQLDGVEVVDGCVPTGHVIVVDTVYDSG